MIEKTRFLACAPARAFELLTERAGAWWPRDRRHTKDPDSTIRIEPTGRFFERAADGTEVELGVVRVFSPPDRLVLDWYPGTGPQEPTSVEILFRPEADGTRIHLTHRAGPHSAAAYEKRAPAYEKSWTLVFEAWSEAAASSPEEP
ncbi:MAG: SRPBCC domain-containing protein [Polyangiaceae bacterium]